MERVLKQAYEQYRKKEKYKGERKRRAYHGTYIIEKGGKAEQILADTVQHNKGSLRDAQNEVNTFLKKRGKVTAGYYTVWKRHQELNPGKPR